jgi:hypothetical protein
MSRSKHTRPRHILAASRVRAPYEPRGVYDITSLRRGARRLKEEGIILAVGEKKPGREPYPLPRVVVQRPSAGQYHPASKRDIIEVLRFFGEEHIYGLRRVVLARTSAGPGRGRLIFGRLLVPGMIILYEQPRAPWVLPGSLAKKEWGRLARAGASIEQISRGLQTVVHWPGETLRDFMLFDVLMHEVAHHTLQQYTGKRPVRIARTTDHEAYADKFAVQCRLHYRQYGQYQKHQTRQAYKEHLR